MPSKADAPAHRTSESGHLTRPERAARGEDARTVAPLESHAEFNPPAENRDPVGLLESQVVTRVPELVPIRYGRMATSPFAFYRGAALVMASDLSVTPSPGLNAQICGDAHLANFGVFGSPERHLLFDLNDFDETYPGPFEWDVKRLAASLEIAARANEYKRRKRRSIVVAAVQSYRETMRAFANESNMEVWYARMDFEQTLRDLRSQLPLEGSRRAAEALAKAHTRDSLNAQEKMTRIVDGQVRIVADPPLVETIETLAPTLDRDEFMADMRTLISEYRTTLVPDRQSLLDQYQMVDMARKVVGVGSVGTRCYILLLQGADNEDPLFLQAKEAHASVLEDFVGTRTPGQAGERVVNGQRLMQAASDIFLGWHRVESATDGVHRDFYIRQLRDWKMSLPPSG